MAGVRKKIIEIAKKSGFNKDEASKIAFAVDEVCTNSIRHSYQNDYTKKIDIRVDADSKNLKIIIRDYGIKPNLKKVKGCRPKKIRPGGLGIYCLKKIMNKVIYDTTNKKGTKITLVKKCR